MSNITPPPPHTTTTCDSSSSSNNTSSSSKSCGRVIRLHFACSAELPIGSVLRVTGSSLITASTEKDDDNNNSTLLAGMKQQNDVIKDSFSSSIEMVTSPDTYPIWRTRKPVTITLHPTTTTTTTPTTTDPHQQHNHAHRYRYLVVTPGAEASMACTVPSIGNTSSENYLPGATTTSAYTQPVTEWENPPMIVEMMETMAMDHIQEESLHGAHGMRCEHHKRLPSTGSSVSLVGGIASTATSGRNANPIVTAKYISNLPFRTLLLPTNEEDLLPLDNTRIDNWNNAQDESWRPFVEISQMIQHRKEQLLTSAVRRNISVASSSEASSAIDMEAMMYGNYNNEEVDQEDIILEDDNQNILDDTSMDDAAPATKETAAVPASTTKKPRRRLFIVCFHLPVKVYKDITTDTWNATWSESLISNTDDSLHKASYDRLWIGTVTCSSIKTEQDKQELTQVLLKMDCIPLFLDKSIISNHYFGMCKQVLWPAFHNVDMLDLSTSKWGGQQQQQQQRVGGEADAGGGGLVIIDNNDSNTNFPLSDWDQARLGVWWEAYVEVNRAFAEVVGQFLLASMDTIKNASAADNTLWIHDYHLALLPKLVNDMEHERFKGRRFTKMIFYLHIPFPTSQIFRELDCGEQILEGMLHADVVGFHAFDHARHFLNAGKRILGLSYESLVGGLIGMRFKGRVVLITMSNVSIEGKTVDQSLQLPSVQQDTHELKNIRHPNRIIICGVDVAQRLSGIGLKFLAYERLLTDYPSWQRKVVLVQKCLVSNNRQMDELVTLRELRFLVRRIRDAFGPHVIDYEEVRGSQLPMAKRLALWCASDIFVSTPVREGLNLQPLEFMYSHKKPASAGVAIVSEFSACSSVLNGALRVNPFDISMTAMHLDKALTMNPEERDSRLARDLEFISTMPSSKWTKNVLRDLVDVKQSSVVDEDDDENNQILDTNGEVDSIGGFLAKEFDSNFSYVNYDALKAAYNATSRRVIVVDFNGTLVVKEPPGKYLKKEILGSSGFKPPEKALQALRDLCADPCNTVFVVSGDAQETLEAALGSIPGLYLAASNGACYSPPSKDNRRKWYSFDLGVDFEAVRQVAVPVLSKYTARTNGSFIKLTHSSIGWSYYSTDPEWGGMQATHLVIELDHVLTKFDVRFVTLKGVVEIVPRRLNKGLIVKQVLREVAARSGGDGVDFILCMGDDVSDEKMFASVYSFISEIDEDNNNVLPSPSVVQSAGDGDHFFSTETPSLTWKNSRQPIFAFTVAVGKKQSHAALYVDDARDVANVLMSMTGKTLEIAPRNNSWDMEETEGDLFA